ncbi:MAG: tyrosine-type recombinase/integrase [Gemmatales bacterium]
MMWQYCLSLYLRTHCTARGMKASTIASYEASLRQFVSYVEVKLQNKAPAAVAARDVLEYLQYLRTDRKNAEAAVSRSLVILKCFYRALVAMEHLKPVENPLVHFPKVKAAPSKLPVYLSEDEVTRLLRSPPGDTVLMVRDRAILGLLYGTGIRASECSTLKEEDVDLENKCIRVTGKGGHQRSVPLNTRVMTVMKAYRQVRGEIDPKACFFLSLRRKQMTRGAIYERVRKWSAVAKIEKAMSPHRLRHTFATHLVKAGVGIVTIRDLLGHRQISSTQIYLHTTAHDLKEAVEKHPIKRLMNDLDQLLPGVKLPWHYPPVRRQQAG